MAQALLAHDAVSCVCQPSSDPEAKPRATIIFTQRSQSPSSCWQSLLLNSRGQWAHTAWPSVNDLSLSSKVVVGCQPQCELHRAINVGFLITPSSTIHFVLPKEQQHYFGFLLSLCFMPLRSWNKWGEGPSPGDSQNMLSILGLPPAVPFIPSSRMCIREDEEGLHKPSHLQL